MVLRILSYNIQEGGEGRLHDIANVIRQQCPDAVALLEAANRAHVETLAGMVDMQLVFGEGNNSEAHIAWLSRYPIARSRNHRDTRLAKTLLEIEVRAEVAGVRLFATHLGSRWDVPQPPDEVPVILQLLRSASGRPHALVGDFNALHPDDPVGQPPDGVQKRGEAVDGAPRQAIGMLLEGGYVDCYRALHPDTPGYTYPSEHPWLRLDYVFASPALARGLRACNVVQGATAAGASDHFPVRAEFALDRSP